MLKKECSKNSTLYSCKKFFSFQHTRNKKEVPQLYKEHLQKKSTTNVILNGERPNAFRLDWDQSNDDSSHHDSIHIKFQKC